MRTWQKTKSIYFAHYRIYCSNCQVISASDNAQVYMRDNQGVIGSGRLRTGHIVEGEEVTLAESDRQSDFFAQSAPGDINQQGGLFHQDQPFLVQQFVMSLAN